MFGWSLILLGGIACLCVASPIASGPRVILRGGAVKAKPLRLTNAPPSPSDEVRLANAPPSPSGEVRPECIVNPAAMMAFAMRDNRALVHPPPSVQDHLVDEEVTDKRSLPETPEENSVEPRDEPETPEEDSAEPKDEPESPEENSAEPKAEPEFPEGQTVLPGEEETTSSDNAEPTTETVEDFSTTVETPTETTAYPEDASTTPETTEETSTHIDEEPSTTVAAEEHSEHPEEESMSSEPETTEGQPKAPEGESKAPEEPAAREEPTAENCEPKATPPSKRKGKAHQHHSTEDEEEEEVPRRKGNRGSTVYKDFFPVTFGAAAPSRTRGSEGGRGNGPVTAVANSFSQGRGAIASSSAVANGSPDAGQYRNSRRSRYRL